MSHQIEAVAFDCYGTLVEFDDAAFGRAYGLICAEQGLDVDGKTFFDKWLEIWRRPRPAEARIVANEPLPLSQPEPETPARPRVAGGAARALDGEPPPFVPYRAEWPPHFAACFQELGLPGDPDVASARLRELLRGAPAYGDSRRVVEALRRRLPVALMSNADNDFLRPCLSRNGLSFPVVISSEDVGAYKPHVSIFAALSEALDVPPTSLLYVGDSRTADVVGGKHAGMRVAWLNRGGIEYHATASGERRPVEPDYEIESLDRLLEILEPPASPRPAFDVRNGRP